MKLPTPKKLPSGSWNIMLRLNGENISITRPTKDQCIAEARYVKSEYKIGKRIRQEKPKKESTIEEMLTAYINSRKTVLSPSSVRGYMTIKNNRFQDYKDKKPSEIDNWQDVIDAEVLAGKSAKTVKNSWALLASAMEYAKIKVPEIKLPAVMPSTRPWLDSDQIKLFVKAVKGTDCEIPSLLALHSLRRSEIMGLTWENIDLDKNTIRVYGSAVFDEKNKLTQKTTNKNQSSKRTVPIMIPELKTALAAVPEDKRTGNVVTCNPNTIWNQVNRICKANKLPEIGVHGLRHSFCSLAVFVGLSPVECMDIGGWSDITTMTRIYTHISNANRLKVENKISAFFKNADENADENSEASKAK